MKIIFVALLCSVAQAAPSPVVLKTFPAPQLRGMAGLLRNQDLALIESNPDGKLRQLTTLTLIAAPPQAVYDLVAFPERYGEFVRNMKESRILPSEPRKGPGEPFVHQYEVSYVVYSIDGRHRFSFPPPDKDTLVVEMADPDENGVRRYRWEFHPVGVGATLLVIYGYAVVPEIGLMKKFLTYARNLEHGLGLIPQLTLMLSMKAEAEKKHQGDKPTLPPNGGSFKFLFDRGGTVAVFRTNQGRLSDISLVARVEAPAEKAMRALKSPMAWSQFIQTITLSKPTSTQGMEGVELEQSLPLLSFKSKFAYRSDATSLDLFGMEGDLRGGRFRWDVRPLDKNRTELTLRASQDLAKSSLVIKQLYKIEPNFEYGINLGLELMLFQGILKKAIEP